MKRDILIVEPGLTEKHYWRDLWRYRELFFVLAWRDVAVRYKQTVIGLAWALLQPLATMIVFTVIFGTVAKLPTDGDAPYALLVYAGLLPWQLFSTAITGASSSLIANANLISKVYFPRLIVPASAIVVAFVDFAIGFMILIGLMVWYQFMPGWEILTLPLFIGMAFLASLGPGLWITALNVKYRDFRYVIPFLVQFGLYISPVGFSANLIPKEWSLLYSMNPMVGVIGGFRWAILGDQNAFDPISMLVGCVVIACFLWFGISSFRRLERSFADLI